MDSAPFICPSISTWPKSAILETPEQKILPAWSSCWNCPTLFNVKSEQSDTGKIKFCSRCDHAGLHAEVFASSWMKVGRHKNSPAAFRRRAYKRGKQLKLFAKGLKKSTSVRRCFRSTFISYTCGLKVSLQCGLSAYRGSSWLLNRGQFSFDCTIIFSIS